MSSCFPEIKKVFGFGCMRLPMNGEEVDIEQFKEMTDLFIDNGFNYFDTAHGYLNGKSETAIKQALSLRHSRDEFILTDKLTEPFFNSQEDIRPFFMKQLDWCGVDYFDFYLMHAQNAGNYPKFKKCKAYETAFELKKEGLIKHVGISFHDKPEVLDQILTDYPEIEIVQIQFNYLDYNDPSVESRNVYDVARAHNKPLLVMEPVKGGNLVNLPPDADKILKELNGGSNASYAIRFAADFEGMRMVLSGMSSLDQMKDNISYMKDFKPLTDAEKAAIERVIGVFKGFDLIPCTSCHYCIEENHCPKKIKIPDMFSCLNSKTMFSSDWNQDFYYNSVLTSGENGKASDCIKCGACERVCPQHLEIRNLLEKVADKFEKKAE